MIKSYFNPRFSSDRSKSEKKRLPFFLEGAQTCRKWTKFAARSARSAKILTHTKGTVTGDSMLAVSPRPWRPGRTGTMRVCSVPRWGASWRMSRFSATLLPYPTMFSTARRGGQFGRGAPHTPHPTATPRHTSRSQVPSPRRPAHGGGGGRRGATKSGLPSKDMRPPLRAWRAMRGAEADSGSSPLPDRAARHLPRLRGSRQRAGSDPAMRRPNRLPQRPEDFPSCRTPASH